MASPDSNSRRTLSQLLLKSFALRMAVITGYGHLGTLQNSSHSATMSLTRMAVLIVLPGAALLNLLGPWLAAILCALFPPGSERRPLRYWAMCTAQLHLDNEVTLRPLSGGEDQFWLVFT
jgi:hypothetical protein